MPQPRWLDDEEQRTWRAYLAATRMLADAVEGQLQREAGLPHAYYEVLVQLSEAPGRAMRMAELADAVRGSRSRLSHAVTRLEEMGWVRRQDCPTDRRGQVAVLTDEGYDALAAAAPGHVECVRRTLFDPLSRTQVRQLRRICDAVVAGQPASDEASADGPDPQPAPSAAQHPAAAGAAASPTASSRGSSSAGTGRLHR